MNNINLRPISLEEAKDRSDGSVVYFVTFINWKGELVTDALALTNLEGGGCSCCFGGSSLEECLRDPATIVQAFECSFEGVAVATKLLENWQAKRVAQ